MSKKKNGRKKPYDVKKSIIDPEEQDPSISESGADDGDFDDLDDADGFEDIDEEFEDIDEIDDTEDDEFDDIEDLEDLADEGFEDIDDIDGPDKYGSDIDPDDYTESDFDEDRSESEKEYVEVVKKYDPDDYTEEDFESVWEGSNDDLSDEDEEKEKKRSGLIWKIGLGFLAVVIIFAAWALGTKSGNVFVGSILAKFGHSKLGTKIDEEEVQFILSRYGISLDEAEFDSLLEKDSTERNQYLLKLIFNKYGISEDPEGTKEILDELAKSGKTINVEQIEILLSRYGVDTSDEARLRAIFDRFEINVNDNEINSILEKDVKERNEAILKIIFEAYGLDTEDEQISSALGDYAEELNAEKILLILSGFGINEYGDITPTPITTDKEIVIRSEDYVKSYLIFGIESVSVDDEGNITFDRSSIGNTDAIILVSINSKDKTIKMTSILRDTFVEIPGFFANKINAVYALGAKGSTTAAEAHEKGAALLVKVIENTFRVKISGWACVNFKSFERIVDRLGGIDLELGEKEARYLNKNNYISNPAYRNVSPGWNHLNGNQVLGYCRVRKVETLGGANNDYGRTLRHRRVINAVIKKYTSSSLTDLIPIMSDILGYIFTDLSEEEFTDALTMVIENRIFTVESLRIPVDGTFYDSSTGGIDNGSGKRITWTLVMGKKKEGTMGSAQIEENVKKLHEFIFLDGQEISDTAEGKTE